MVDIRGEQGDKANRDLGVEFYGGCFHDTRA